jgi:prepilin-type N-terminal cleavage/methylation domain-containing protein
LGHSTNDEKNLKSRPKTKKIFGFTLAEVLITLGIIGVVSAMTIPALMNKCQKVVLANQAKKEYAMWTQVFKNILADNNTTSLSETELWGKIEGYRVYYTPNPTTTNTAFWSELGKYVKISPSGAYNYIKTYMNEARIFIFYSKNYPIYLSNGSQLTQYYFYKTPYRKTDAVCSQIKALGGSMCSVIGYILIDVNGAKGPNIRGRDLFQFEISDEGVLYPYGGKDWALYEYQTPIDPTRTVEEYEYTDEYGHEHTSTVTTGSQNNYYWKNFYNGTKEENANKWGGYRTGQLMEEGWKMNY